MEILHRNLVKNAYFGTIGFWWDSEDIDAIGGILSSRILEIALEEGNFMQLNFISD